MLKYNGRRVSEAASPCLPQILLKAYRFDRVSNTLIRKYLPFAYANLLHLNILEVHTLQYNI